MTKFELFGHEPSFLPDGYEWQLAWHDEFDGTQLDMTKWDHRFCMMGKRHATWQPEGVSLDGNSNCVFKIFEKDGMICSSQLQTGYNYMDEPNGDTATYGKTVWPIGKLKKSKYLHRYGYYECRCRLQQKNGWWSAFWLQSPTIGARFEPEWCGIESDIMEYFNSGKSTCGNIMSGYGSQFHEEGRVKYDLPETEDGWHYFGMDWQPDGYVFYCDGKEVSRCSDHVSHVPEFILLTTEVQGYRSSNDEVKLLGMGGKTVKSAPYYIQDEFTDDAFIVDHVRVFDKIK